MCEWKPDFDALNERGTYTALSYSRDGFPMMNCGTSGIWMCLKCSGVE